MKGDIMDRLKKIIIIIVVCIIIVIGLMFLILKQSSKNEGNPYGNQTEIYKESLKQMEEERF